MALDTKYFKVKKDLVQLPNGEKRDWIYWDSPDSAMVIGMTKEKKLVMIRQYRYMVDDEVIEFPSGYKKNTETIEKGAQREFEEETGFACSSLIKLGAFYETYGQLNRKIHMYFARNVAIANRRYDEDDDVQEDIKVVLVDFDKAVEMARDNTIVAMGSALAIVLLKEKIDGRFITL
ncbi:MAG: NUDIX hydrolase [Patescibacteria group bacterium]